MSTGCRKLADRFRQPLEGGQQDIRKYEIERGARPHATVGKTVPLNDLDESANAVEARIVPRHSNAHGINVASQHRPPHRPCCGNGEHPGPGADIKNTTRVSSLENAVERHEAAARRAMMPGAEGECSLDLDADPIWRNTVAVVGAMDHKAPDGDRRQPSEAVSHPIARCDGREHDALAHRIAGEIAEEHAHRVLIRWALEINFDGPGAHLFKDRNSCFTGLEYLQQGLVREGIEEPSRRAAVGDKPGKHGSSG